MTDRSVTLEHLCAGCMVDKGDASRCPHCGWVEGTMPDSPAQLPPRTLLIDKYMLGRVLGQGGFGITYLAWDLSLGKKLAIKEYFPREICSRGRDTTTLQPSAQRNRVDFEYGLGKFKEEGQNLARFRDYPGIVALLDYFTANGTAYIVMAYMEGMTFKQYLEDKPNGKIGFDAALAILNPVMDALREVHSIGMLHRDISPDNIYLNLDQHVKILDFGATRYAMRDQSRSLTVLFKPGYAPFEQYSSGGKQGAWSDVYAVGATFYRALTGHAPPESPDRMNHDELVLPSALGIRMPAKTESALFKALAVRLENRFQTMKEFQEAVNPPLAPVPGPVAASERFEWKIATGVLLATTLLFAGLWFSRWHTAAQPANAGGDTELRNQLQDTQSKLDNLTQEYQSARQNLAQSASSLSAVMVERDDLRARNQQLMQNSPKANEQANQPRRQVADNKPPLSAVPELKATYVQFYDFDRLNNTRTPNNGVFLSGGTRRILCAVGGPNPAQGSQPFTGQLTISFVAPSGAARNKVDLTVQTAPGQSTWAAMAYIGSDQPGTIEKGNWHIQVTSGADVLKSATFTVN